MHLSLDAITKQFGTLSALKDVNIEVNEGEFFCLLGPSSAGKTTTLRIICGLERLDAGTIRIDGRDVTCTPIQGRGIAMIFQTFALYPHLTTRQNLGYPLREERLSRDEIMRRVGEIAELLMIEHVLDRKPATLSGGEQQRVAIGRALIRRPKLLLLDEPLTNLDAKLRADMRTEFKRLHRDLGITMIYATPDQLEALTMGERVAVIQNGTISQIGSPEQLYHRPKNTSVASLIGSPPINLLSGQATKGQINLGFTQIDGDNLTVGDRAVTVGIHPHDIRLGHTDNTNCFFGTVTLVELLGDIAIVEATNMNSSFKTVIRGSEIGHIVPGSTLPFNISDNAIMFFDKTTGERIQTTLQ